MKRTGTPRSAPSGWPFQQPSSELRSPTTSSFHPYVQRTHSLLPTGTDSALCRCLRLPARLPVTCPPREGCELRARPRARERCHPHAARAQQKIKCSVTSQAAPQP